jgi:glycosyltransferase involved in cell wall biosynthesis
MSSIVFENGETPELVSVVIPTRRGERFIGETLESISQQRYTHWEVIVVEDGSDDGTREIVEEFARRHRPHRVEYTRNERNFGAAHSRNVAFAKAQGEYVALVDNDDRWLPNHLANAVAALQDTDADIVYSTVLMIEDETDLLIGLWGPSSDEVKNFPHGMFRRNFVTPSASVMRRQVLADVGPWETDLKYCEDAGFWMRCIVEGKQFLHLGGCHCLYRKNHAGATTSKMCGTLEEFAEIVERYMDAPGLKRRDCRRSVSKSYARASLLHAKSNPARDRSADRRRAAPLMWKAWRLRPGRVSHLFQAAWLALTNIGRRPPEVPAEPIHSSKTRTAHGRRAAA